jgi:outer membrane protein insertion porin family
MDLKNTFHKKRIFGMLLLAAILASGCSNVKYLGENEDLYTGSRIRFEKEEPIAGLSNLESELESVMRPEPNATFLGMRPRLFLYNLAGEPTGKGLRHLMKNRFGRPPVLFEDVSIPRTTRLLENRLQNLGYFDAKVVSEVNRKKQKASVDYTVSLRPPYTYIELHPTSGQDSLQQRIDQTLEASLVKLGAQYRLETLRNDRERIADILKREGYYFFHPDHILFQADTTVGDRGVEVFTTLKEDMPPQASQAYRFGHIRVFADYLATDVAGAYTDSIMPRPGLFVFDKQDQFKASTLANAVFFRQGELYNIENHDRTLNHLLGLGVFKFVNIRFEESMFNGLPALDVNIMLTPVEKKSLSAELKGVTKSNNFAGPGLNVSFSNRNALGGAEQLRFSANVAYEALIARNLGPASSIETGLSAELIYPRFVIPFKIRRLAPILLPKTSFLLGFNYLNRTDAFSLSSIRLQYGYSWNQRISTNHRLSPVVLNWFNLGKVSENLSGELLAGDLFRRGLFEQFIAGSEYSYTYNSQLKHKRRNDLYLNLNLDVAGNLAYGLFHLFGAPTNEEGNFQVLGQGLSQYSKADFDLRFYRQLGGGQRLATRLIAGLGVPYGNSQTLPYLKQFNIGGSNSIRAFHPRSLGPGTYQSPDSLQGRFNIHQTGEVKLEFSLEYRFDITRIFKGAFFVDAGNIWRLDEDEKTPGGEFRWDSFYKQIAIGAGTGLRIDASIFVLRFDFAFPLALPWDTGSFFQPIEPFKKDWRRQNLIFNLGIGYPF